jgi:uncharacterized repeat protein (TIGR02543 family)
MTALGMPDSPSGDIVAMPRSAIEHSNQYFGFLGWRSSLPDLNWSGYTDWAGDNGYTESTVSDFLNSHPVEDLPLDAFPLYQPGDVVLSVKQTMTAEWYQDLYRVDFDLNYDGPDNWYSSSELGKEAPRLSVPAGNTIVSPLDPSRTDYTFAGWYKDARYTQAWDFGTDEVTTDTVLYAKWSAVAYNVIYHSDGASGGNAPIDSGSPYIAGSTVTVVGPGTLRKTDHSFNGWSTVPGDTVPMYAPGETFSIAANVDLYPLWTFSPGGDGSEKNYYINATADDNSSIHPSGVVVVSSGSSATFTFSAKNGYRLDAVYVDGTAISAEKMASGKYTFFDVRANHTINVVSKVDDSGAGNGNGNGGGNGNGSEPDDNKNKGEWAVLNLICAILAILVGLIAVASGKGRFKKDDEEKRSKPAMFLRITALILGIISVVIFFLTEDMSLPVAFTDKWTLLMFILFLVTAIATLISSRFDVAKKDDTGKENEPNQ